MTNAPLCRIETIEEDQATGLLKESYDALRQDGGTVGNLYKAFSAYPQPLLAADRLYKILLHDDTAPLVPWLRELIAVQVAILTGCDYALTHHGANLRHLYGDPDEADAIIAALKDDDLAADRIDARLRATLAFNAKLTRAPETMAEADIAALRQQGLSDAAISQVIQVSANFAYWVRVINALGVRQGDEPVGRYGP